MRGARPAIVIGRSHRPVARGAADATVGAHDDSIHAAGSDTAARRGVLLDSTQAVPQPTLRGVLDADSCEVLLIRHGRSADVVPGTPESADPPLHVLGIEQAAALAARLAPVELHGVYSSHLARAMQTALPLAESRGSDPRDPCRSRGDPVG